MQPSTDELKFCVHGFTLLVPSLLIDKNSSGVRTASYVLVDRGEGDLKASAISFQDLQIYSELIIKFPFEPFLSKVDQFPQ